MKRSESSSKKKMERKTIEKNRRIRMKSLCFKLVSMIPDHHFKLPKEFLSHLDQINEAASYIKIMRERIEGLNRRKEKLKNDAGGSIGRATKNTANNVGRSKSLPILAVKELGFGVEVVLISGLNNNFMLSKVITVIEQEAADVISVYISRIGHKIVHTLHAQVKITRVGVDASRISERIHEMIASIK